MSKVRIPKQLFVVLNGALNPQNPPMGFLHEYNPNTATGKKKMKTQFEWAYGSRYDVFFDGGVWRRQGHRYDYPPNSTRAVRVDVDEIIPQENAPLVWDNVPTDGFKIESATSRWSTSNKLWKVLDPRGVVFEISTDNFEKIVLNGTIKQGFIQEKCVWVGNKNLMLAP